MDHRFGDPIYFSKAIPIKLNKKIKEKTIKVIAHI
jgi:hypothetical protein